MRRLRTFNGGEPVDDHRVRISGSYGAGGLGGVLGLSGRVEAQRHRLDLAQLSDGLRGSDVLRGVDRRSTLRGVDRCGAAGELGEPVRAEAEGLGLDGGEGLAEGVSELLWLAAHELEEVVEEELNAVFEASLVEHGEDALDVAVAGAAVVGAAEGAGAAVERGGAVLEIAGLR